MTLSEYFKLRFDSSLLSKLNGFAYLFYSIFTASSVIYGISTSISVVTQFSVYACIAMVGATTILYTSLGGIRGVTWSDVFQLCMMISGQLFILIRGTYIVGGPSKVWELAGNGSRLNFFDFNISPFVRQSFWSLLIGGTLRWCIKYNVDQSILQRVNATKSIRQVQFMMLINSIGSVLIISSSSLIGIVIFANYYDCDPLSAHEITGVKNPNQLLAYFVSNKLNVVPGISGFIQGALLSAAMSTLSSLLNSQATIFWKDYFKEFSYFQQLDDKRSLYTARILVICFGLICVLFSYLFLFINSTNLIELTVLVNSVMLPACWGYSSTRHVFLFCE